MEEVKISRQYEIGASTEVLSLIHQPDTNIVIFKRDVSSLWEDIESLLEKEFDFRASGDIDSIQADLSVQLNNKQFGGVAKDVFDLLQLFAKVSNVESFRLFFGNVNTNMCRKFHTDINDLRMLCTYSGQGTMWLKEDNIKRDALRLPSSQEQDIVIDENDIKQVETGSAVILKGALYPKEGTKAVVHRSPTIEETRERRLLLRIDTNECLAH